jgi:hypothetical protein
MMREDLSDTIDDLVSLKQAAQQAGRSYSWARDRAADGRFECYPIHGSKRFLVTAKSLAKEIERDRERRRASARRRPMAHLRLVVDNTR